LKSSHRYLKLIPKTRTSEEAENESTSDSPVVNGVFMSAGRGKGISSRSSQNDGNAEGRDKWLLRAEVFITSLGLFIGIGSIIFLIQQTQEMKAQTVRQAEAVEAQTEALQLDAISTIYGSILELDKTFLAYPELRPYFYSGEVISPTDDKYNKVLSIAEYQLDLFDLFWQHSSYLSKRQDWVAWEKWISAGFADSPIMCKHLNALQDTYSEGLVDFAVDTCAPGTIQKRD
jgi:hypothetical protein